MILFTALVFVGFAPSAQSLLLLLWSAE